LAIVAIKVIKVAAVKAVPLAAKAAKTTWTVANTPPAVGAAGGVTNFTLNNIGTNRFTVHGLASSAIAGAVGGKSAAALRQHPFVGGVVAGAAEGLINRGLTRRLTRNR